MTAAMIIALLNEYTLILHIHGLRNLCPNTICHDTRISDHEVIVWHWFPTWG